MQLFSLLFLRSVGQITCVRSLLSANSLNPASVWAAAELTCHFVHIFQHSQIDNSNMLHRFQ